MAALRLLLGILLVAAEGMSDCGLQVQTTSGPIVGRKLISDEKNQVDAFQGIPFAKPPVGELRFKKPVPPDPWTDPRETKTFGRRCIQKDNIPGTETRIGPDSEDCLTLNVFTPSSRCNSSTTIPVIVFIHGGAFNSDSVIPYGDVNIGQNVVSKSVVVVTLEYRLGFLGFWSTGDEHCPGNNALWDLTLALKWVKENIAKFGGDPENVTLIGQSAGGVMVDMLSLSPHSRDLFQKVICMAGTTEMEWGISYQVVETCRRMAEEVGVTSYRDSAKFLDDLRKIPAQRFRASETISTENLTETILGPRYDGDFFPKSFAELRKEAPVKPRIIGQSRAEGIIGTMRSEGKPSELDKIAALIFPERRFLEDSRKLRDEYVDRILNDTTGDVIQVKKAIVEATGDKDFSIGTLEGVMDWLERGSTVYMYQFNHYNENMFGPLGPKFPYKDATHVTDISYLFGACLYYAPFNFTEDDQKVIDIMSMYITEFAKSGNPNGPSSTLAKWLPATKEEPQKHLEISLNPTMQDVFIHGRPLWCVEKRRTLFR